MQRLRFVKQPRGSSQNVCNISRFHKIGQRALISSRCMAHKSITPQSFHINNNNYSSWRNNSSASAPRLQAAPHHSKIVFTTKLSAHLSSSFQLARSSAFIKTQIIQPMISASRSSSSFPTPTKISGPLSPRRACVPLTFGQQLTGAYFTPSKRLIFTEIKNFFKRGDDQSVQNGGQDKAEDLQGKDQQNELEQNQSLQNEAQQGQNQQQQKEVQQGQIQTEFAQRRGHQNDVQQSQGQPHQYPHEVTETRKSSPRAHSTSTVQRHNKPVQRVDTVENPTQTYQLFDKTRSAHDFEKLTEFYDSNAQKPEGLVVKYLHAILREMRQKFGKKKELEALWHQEFERLKTPRLIVQCQIEFLDFQKNTQAIWNLWTEQLEGQMDQLPHEVLDILARSAARLGKTASMQRFLQVIRDRGKLESSHTMNSVIQEFLANKESAAALKYVRELPRTEETSEKVRSPGFQEFEQLISEVTVLRDKVFLVQEALARGVCPRPTFLHEVFAELTRDPAYINTAEEIFHKVHEYKAQRAALLVVNLAYIYASHMSSGPAPASAIGTGETDNNAHSKLRNKLLDLCNDTLQGKFAFQLNNPARLQWYLLAAHGAAEDDVAFRAEWEKNGSALLGSPEVNAMWVSRRVARFVLPSLALWASAEDVRQVLKIASQSNRGIEPWIVHSLMSGAKRRSDEAALLTELYDRYKTDPQIAAKSNQQAHPVVHNAMLVWHERRADKQGLMSVLSDMKAASVRMSHVTYMTLVRFFLSKNAEDPSTALSLIREAEAASPSQAHPGLYAYYLHYLLGKNRLSDARSFFATIPSTLQPNPLEFPELFDK